MEWAIVVVSAVSCILSIVNLKLVMDAKKKVRQLRGRK